MFNTLPKIIFQNYFPVALFVLRPSLWSSGQSFWLKIQRSRVRFPALPNFLNSSGSGTESTQPREPQGGQLRSYLNKKSGGSDQGNRDTVVGSRCADHVTPPLSAK